MDATEAHYEAATFLQHILATGKFDTASRDAAYKGAGATARAMLQAFAAMQGPRSASGMLSPSMS